MAQTGPGKAYRSGISDFELFQMFSDDKAAEKWFESVRWWNGLRCAHCDSENVQIGPKHPHMPYRCRTCRKFFSVKTNGLMHSSNLGYQKWAFAVYIINTNIKGISSMHLSRRLGVTQQTAWHMAHKIRASFTDEAKRVFGFHRFDGPTEVDEAYIGGKESNKHADKKLNAGRGAVGKTAIVGIKDRRTNQVHVEVVDDTTKQTLQDFVTEWTKDDTVVYTDEARAYIGLPREHHTIAHGKGEYVRYEVHVSDVGEFIEHQISTNGMESFWSLFKRGYVGTYHKMSAKHLHRYVTEFEGRHNSREFDTLEQMEGTVAGMAGKRLRWTDITAD